MLVYYDIVFYTIIIRSSRRYMPKSIFLEIYSAQDIDGDIH